MSHCLQVAASYHGNYVAIEILQSFKYDLNYELSNEDGLSGYRLRPSEYKAVAILLQKIIIINHHSRKPCTSDAA